MNDVHLLFKDINSFSCPSDNSLCNTNEVSARLLSIFFAMFAYIKEDQA